MTPEPTPELLLRLTRPGPRYTSYPTVPLWSRDFPVEAFVEGLQGLRAPSSVYVHVPFCKEQCTFCGCNMVVSGRRDSGTRYLDELERQVEALPLAQESVEVVRIHLGGGTPTWLEPQDLERLYAIVRRRFKPIEGAELSVEADPEVTTDEQVDTLAALGVTRLSMGVQSFDPVVLAAVNRPQEHTRVHAIMERCRSLGMGSLNLDLMTGLPHQTLERFEDTLAKTLEMRPDRLAIFGAWYQQLWAESLGKDGKGTTPIAALGPVDQHSQLQLFIAGPRDKLFTVITTDRAGQGPRIDPELAKLAGEPGLGGKTIGDLVAAQGRATAETLAKNGCPVRTMHLPRIDAEGLGELLMHFMLETIIAAQLIGVDAFDQPAVEEGKVLAKSYLSGA